MSTEFISTGNGGFFDLADRLGGSTPLRRILSIIRLQGICNTILCETDELFKARTCTSALDNSWCARCRDQFRVLETDSVFVRKTCFKLFFFKYASQENFKDLCNDDLLGYCVVHHDIFNPNDKPSSDRVKCYVLESVMVADKDITGFITPPSTSNVNVLGKEFTIEGGYFTQQDYYTTSCVHASLKCTFKNILPDLDDNAINKIVSIDNNKRYGREGIVIHEIRKVVDVFSEGMFVTEVIRAASMLTWEFVRTIYMAIESKYPTLLLFRSPSFQDAGFRANHVNGHSMAVVGHTFSSHTWDSYGGYYFHPDAPAHLRSSVLWCEQFVVSDDNMGPFYHLPMRFFHELNTQTTFGGGRFIWNNQLSSDLYTVICMNKKSPSVQTLLQIEKTALNFLEWAYDELDKKDIIEENRILELFFLNAFRSSTELGDDINCGFILRTIYVAKDDYLNNIKEMQCCVGGAALCALKDVIRDSLPPCFVVIEFSLNELFWINQAKVCEIIIDPDKFLMDEREKPADCVIFLRIPFYGALFAEGALTVAMTIEQEKPYSAMITVSQGAQL